jgi:hypothetical protein
MGQYPLTDGRVKEDTVGSKQTKGGGLPEYRKELVRLIKVARDNGWRVDATADGYAFKPPIVIAPHDRLGHPGDRQPEVAATAPGAPGMTGPPVLVAEGRNAEMAKQWQVTVVCRGNEEVPEEVLSAAMGDALAALEGYGAAGSVGNRSYSLTLSAKGHDRESAKLEAAKALRQAVAAGLPDWPLASMLAQPAGSSLPALVGTPQVARILGVNPERVRELARLNETFPAPAGRVGRNRVWTEESIRAWQATWPRKAGRPRKAASSLTAAEGKR